MDQTSVGWILAGLGMSGANNRLGQRVELGEAWMLRVV